MMVYVLNLCDMDWTTCLGVFSSEKSLADAQETFEPFLREFERWEVIETPLDTLTTFRREPNP